MTSKVQPIPEGYHTATPYLIVSGARNCKSVLLPWDNREAAGFIRSFYN